MPSRRTHGPSLSDQGIGPDDATCDHGVYIWYGECGPCVAEARASEEPRGANPWPDLDELEDLPF